VLGTNGDALAIWDVRTGEIVRERRWVGVFSADGNRLLTYSRSRAEIELIDFRRDEVIRRFPAPKGNYPPFLTLLPGDREAALWNRSTRTAELWDTTKGKLARRIALGPTWVNDHYIRGAFSRDGKRMLTSHDDGFVRLWDVAAGREIWRAPVEGSVRGLLFSRNGRYAAAGSELGEVYVWRLPDRPGPLPRHDDRPEFRNLPGLERGHVWSYYVYHTAWSPDGRHYLATGARDINQVRVWNAATGELVRVVPGWQWAAFTPDGKHVLAVSLDHSLRLWELTTGREVRRLEGHTDGVVSFAISTDGKRVLSVSPDRTLRLWNLDNGKELARQPNPFWADRPVFSPDGKRALTHDGDCKVHMWEVDGLRLLRTWPLPRKEAFQLLRFLPGSREFVVVSPTAARWFAVDADREHRVLHLKTGTGDTNGWWTISQDATRLVMHVRSNGGLRVLELPSGKQLARFKAPPRLLDLIRHMRNPWWLYGLSDLSPDGRRLVVPVFPSEAGRVYVYRLPAKE
jgi:WD40 repeat protein